MDTLGVKASKNTVKDEAKLAKKFLVGIKRKAQRGQLSRSFTLRKLLAILAGEEAGLSKTAS